jgi:hypothetical protein
MEHAGRAASNTTEITMRSLFAITADLVAVAESIDDSGELSPDVEAFFGTLETEEAEKLDNYVNLVKQLDAEAVAAVAEAEQYRAKATARTNAVARLKARLKLHLEQTGRTKVATTTNRTIRIQANGGKVPLILADGLDAYALPGAFQKVTVSPNTEAIRDALEAGEQLPFAALGEKETHLRIS